MSVPDPAPLPRLGEVFFDVRGNSRSMRLSWYADTGVAVFSIWQAGMCTGTFRLPIADLGRMIELLQRGPAPRRRGPVPVPVSGAERVDRDFGQPPENSRPAGDEPDSGSGDDLADFVQGDFATDYGAADYRAADYGAADYNAADYRAAGHRGGGAGPDSAGYRPVDEPARSYPAPGYVAGDQPTGEHGRGEHGRGEHRLGEHGRGEHQGGGASDERWADRGTRSYGTQERPDPGYGTAYADRGYIETRGADRGTRDREYADRAYGAAGYGGADPGQAGYLGTSQAADYRRGDQRTDGGYQPPSYEPADYWSRSPSGGDPEYGSGDYSTGAFARHGADRSRDYTDGGVSYRDDRVVPPYAQGQEQSYRNDNLAPGGGYRGDIGDPAYPADRPPVSPSSGYPEQAGPQDGYSYGSDYRYRLAAEPDSDERNSVGRPTGRRAG